MRAIDVIQVSPANALAESASVMIFQQRLDVGLMLYKQAIALCNHNEEDLKLSVCAAVCNIYALYGDAVGFFEFVKDQRLLPKSIKSNRLMKYKESYAKIFKSAGVIYRIDRDLESAKSYLQRSLNLEPGCFDSSIELIVALIESRDWNTALKKIKEVDAALNALAAKGTAFIGTYSVTMYQLRINEKFGLVNQILDNYTEANRCYLIALKHYAKEDKRIRGIANISLRNQTTMSLNNHFSTVSLSLVLMKIQTILRSDIDENDIKTKYASDFSFMKALIGNVSKALSVTEGLLIAGSPFSIQHSNNRMRQQILEVFITLYTSQDFDAIDSELNYIVLQVKQSKTQYDSSCIAILAKALSLRHNYHAIIDLKDHFVFSNDNNTLVMLKVLGTAYYGTENYEEAKVYFELLLAKNNSAHVAHSLGGICCLLGEFGEARTNYKIALKKEPGNHLFELMVKVTNIFDYIVLNEDNLEVRLGKLKIVLISAQQLFNEFPEMYSDKITIECSSPYAEVMYLLVVAKFIFIQTKLWDQITSIKTEAEVEAITPEDEARYSSALSQVEKADIRERIKKYCYHDKESSPVFPDPLKASIPTKEECKSVLPQPGDEGVFLFKAMPADSGKKTYCYFDKDKLRKTISKENLERAERLVTECERLLVDDGQDKPGVKRDNHNFFVKLPNEARIQGRFIMLGTYNIIIFDEGFGSHVAYEKVRQENHSQCAQK